MDTKLKRFKYSFFTKFICWLTAVLLFCLSFAVGLKVLLGVYFFGFDGMFENKKTSFFATEPVATQLAYNFNGVHQLGIKNTAKLRKVLESEKSDVVNELTDKYLDAKASLIKNELEYAVNDFSENGGIEYYENDNGSDITVPYTDVSYTVVSGAEDYSVEDYYPENIKKAAQILANASGREFLKYAELVRTEAFETVGCFAYSDDTLPGSSFDVAVDIPYTCTEAQAMEKIGKIYDTSVEIYLESYTENTAAEYFDVSPEYLKNFKFYTENYDGNVYSNIDTIPDNLSEYENYILCVDGKISIVGFENFNFERYDFETVLQSDTPKKLCIYLNDDFNEDDVYGGLYKTYNALVSENFAKVIIFFAVALLLCVFVTIVWLRLCGHKIGREKPETALIDKIPTDIHFVITASLLFCLTYFFLVITDEIGFYPMEVVAKKSFIFLLYSYLAVALSVFYEWLSSVVRIKKCGESFFKKTLIYRVLRALIGGLKRFFNIFAYKPRKMRRRVILFFAGYLCINFASVLTEFILFSSDIFIGCVLLLLWWLLFNGYAIYEFSKFVQQLDMIIDCSSRNESIDFKKQKVPQALRILAENISNNNDKLNLAIAEAVKNEHMKTQLITNVSHDLKTPLTSLISYSDLLSKCDIQGDDAKKYVNVINSQSVKLKNLIEDLIEASKVSTGNVTLNKTQLNLSELAVQAIVEFTPEIEKNGNELKFTEPETPPVIFADGKKTYRILSNLLNNAKKYSAPDTRIYASVYRDGNYGCFEIKNVSKEPLNISASELTERFVRGDDSRTKEGNGLGLSIAKDLCTLQNGTLDITIDGDLFKAQVKLPINS